MKANCFVEESKQLQEKQVKSKMKNPENEYTITFLYAPLNFQAHM